MSESNLRKIVHGLAAGMSFSFLAACASSRNSGNYEFTASNCMEKGTSIVANAFPGKKARNSCPKELLEIYENAQGPAVAAVNMKDRVQKDIADVVKPHMPPRWGESFVFAQNLYLDPSKRGDVLLVTWDCTQASPSTVTQQYFTPSGATRFAFTRAAVPIADSGGKYAFCIGDSMKAKTPQAHIVKEPLPPIDDVPRNESIIAQIPIPQKDQKETLEEQVAAKQDVQKSTLPTDSRQVYEVSFTLEKGGSLWKSFSSIGRLDALETYMANKGITQDDARKLRAGYTDTIALFLDDVAMQKAKGASAIKIRKLDAEEKQGSIINLDTILGPKRVADSGTKEGASSLEYGANGDVKGLPDSYIKPEYEHTSRLKKVAMDVYDSSKPTNNTLLSLLAPYSSQKVSELQEQAAKEAGYALQAIEKDAMLESAVANALLGLRQRGFDEAIERGYSPLRATMAAESYAQEQIKGMLKQVYEGAVASCRRVSQGDLAGCLAGEGQNVAQEQIVIVKRVELQNPAMSLYQMRQKYAVVEH